jgi:hypothetical protein
VIVTEVLINSLIRTRAPLFLSCIPTYTWQYQYILHPLLRLTGKDTLLSANIADRWVADLLRTQQVSCSDLDQETDHRDSHFRGFSQYLKENVEIILQITPPTVSFHILYTSLYTNHHIIRWYCILSYLNNILNKPTINKIKTASSHRISSHQTGGSRYWQLRKIYNLLLTIGLYLSQKQSRALYFFLSLSLSLWLYSPLDLDLFFSSLIL